MSTFIIAAGLLTLLSIAGLLYPLLRKGGSGPTRSSDELSLAVLREQQDELQTQQQAGTVAPEMFIQEQADLQRRALEDGQHAAAPAPRVTGRRTTLAVTLAVLLPLAVVLGYLGLGSPATLQAPAAAPATAGQHAVSPEQIAAMVARLAERLQNNPEDGEGWLMLGRSYSVMGRYPEAAAAFGRAAAILPPDAGLLADYADILAMAQGRKLAGEPEKIVARALAIDPRHIKARALAGSAAFEQENYSRAVDQWQMILTQVPADSPVAEGMRRSIEDARRRIAANHPTPLAASEASGDAGRAPETSPASVSRASVSGEVRLAPALLARLPASATLFVFARAVDGSRVPLAMARIGAAKFPVNFTLDDSTSMMPNRRLSDAPRVIIGARLSLSGDAIGKAGDLEGYSEPVNTGNQRVVVTIANVVN